MRGTIKRDFDSIYGVLASQILKASIRKEIKTDI